MSTEFGSAEVVDTSAPVEPANDAGTPEDVKQANGAFDPSTLDFGEDVQVKEWIEKKGLKSVEDIARTAYGAEKLVGQRATDIPGQDATEEELEAFYAKAGRPQEASGYEFNLPEGIPEDFPYDAEARDKFASQAHKAGLRPEQARALHDWFVKEQAGTFSASADAGKAAEAERVEAIQKDVQAATKQLETAFEAPSGSDQFKANINHALRFVNENGGDNLRAELIESGVLVQDDKGGTTIRRPTVIAAMAKAGKALYSEGGSHGGRGGVSAADNPYR